MKNRKPWFNSRSRHMVKNTGKTSPGDNGGRKSAKGVEFKHATLTKAGDDKKRWTGIDIDGNPSVNPKQKPS